MMSNLIKKLCITAMVLCMAISTPVMAAGVYPETADVFAGQDGYVYYRSTSQFVDGVSQEYYAWEKHPTNDMAVVCTGMVRIMDDTSIRKECLISSMSYGKTYTVVTSLSYKGVTLTQSVSRTEYADGSQTDPVMVYTTDASGWVTSLRYPWL